MRGSRQEGERAFQVEERTRETGSGTVTSAVSDTPAPLGRCQGLTLDHLGFSMQLSALDAYSFRNKMPLKFLNKRT